MELRNDPALLRNYLLGTTYGGAGLLRRVEQRVSEQTQVDGPAYRTGSVIPTGVSVGKDHGSDSGFSETTFALLVGLIQWLGHGLGRTPPGHSERALLEYLVRNHITDLDALLGSDGRLEQVRRRVEEELREPTEAQIQNCRDLVDFLRAWMTSDCDHEWEEVERDGKLVVHACDCGARRYLHGEDQWLAV